MLGHKMAKDLSRFSQLEEKKQEREKTKVSQQKTNALTLGEADAAIS